MTEQDLSLEDAQEPPAPPKSRKKELTLAMAAFLAMVAFVSVGFYFIKENAAEPIVEGSTIPDFTFETLDGRKVSMSDYRGKKAVFINIWATWCTPCRREMPSMQRLYQNMAGQDFEMLAISIDVKGREVVEPFVKELGLTFPILLDVDNKSKNIFQTRAVPETIVVDKNGVVQRRVVGEADWGNPMVAEMIGRMIQRESPTGP